MKLTSKIRLDYHITTESYSVHDPVESRRHDSERIDLYMVSYNFHGGTNLLEDIDIKIAIKKLIDWFFDNGIEDYTMDSMTKTTDPGLKPLLEIRGEFQCHELPKGLELNSSFNN